MLDVYSDAVPGQGAVEFPEPYQRTEAPPSPILVRTTRDPRRIDAWVLVLVSGGISPAARAAAGVLELWVAPDDAALALAELDAADAEETQARSAASARAAPEPAATRHASTAGVLMAALLLAFFAVTGTRAAGAGWFAAGASDAERVLQGEWWRAVTALTLHADAAHVVSNVGIGTLVVGAVMRTEGIGWGAALVLASGTAGNMINAWAHQSLHSSVGFSTAVFGAIGILGGLGYARRKRRAHELRSTWLALGASLALLAALGASERSDIFAHLFGGLAGVALGLLVGLSGVRPRTHAGQTLAGLAAAAVVIGSWLVALP